ncbi:MAG: calcium/sodium antiporter [Alphaproteobacteria bacterium]|nr:calcium/sodium antiporter [Alphaproteobacteria bacterium]
MIQDIVFLAVGLAVLLVSGDILVRGAVALATAINVPPLLVGLTIVAFGTSAPELVVAIQAVLQDKDGIAIGNIVGSNIANVLLVIGLPALIYPMSAHVSGLPRNAAFMLAATAAFCAFAFIDRAITPASGLALFIGIIGFVAFAGLRAAKTGGEDPIIDDVAEYGGGGLSVRTVLFLIFGLVGLPFGAQLLVENGVAIAASLGVRESLIGLTLVAFGTSLPELATVAAAALHKKSDVAIGNIVGSNIFNLLAVGGAAGLAGGASFDQSALSFDLPVMIATAVLLAGFVFLKRDIGRVSGLCMALGYVGFVAILAARGL